MDIHGIRQALRTKSVYDIPLRVTFYARVSSESDEQLNSLGNQVSYYEELIGKNVHWTYVDGYIDEGLSAATTKKRENFHRMDACPVRDVLSRLGDKWTMLVLVTLKANGTMRFCDIQKTIGDISQRMLTVTLRSLETDGLIVRKVYAEVPPRVEYNLTETGCSLMPHIESLVGWALEHMNDILNRRSLQN